MSTEKPHMALSDRLKALKQSWNLTQKEMALRLDIAVSTYQYYERGERDIPAKLLIKIASFGVNSNWLLTGQGEMFLENGQNPIKRNAPVSKPPVGNAIRVYNNVLKRTGLELDPEGQEKLFKIIQDMLADDETDETENSIVNSISITNHKVKGV